MTYEAFRETASKRDLKGGRDHPISKATNRALTSRKLHQVEESKIRSKIEG